MTTRWIAATVVVLVACNAPHDVSAARAQAAQTAPLPTGTLDQLLAPIALYPDPLLAQMLLSAAEPAKITELDTWLTANQKLKGTPLQDAAVKAGFDASFVALVLFPQVVAKMAHDIAWTTALGTAFTSDRSAVFASIQKLRLQAKNVGTLKSSPQQEVETKTTPAGEQVIVIEPTNPQIVYVLNTTPRWSTPSPTTVVVQEDDDSGARIAADRVHGRNCDRRGGGQQLLLRSVRLARRRLHVRRLGRLRDARKTREDWQDHRGTCRRRGDRAENRTEQRTDRAGTSQEQRTDRTQARQENRPESASQRTATPSATSQAKSSGRTGSTEARGYGDGTKTQPTTQRTKGSSDAFSGYSNGKSERSSSARGQGSRSSSRGGGGGGGRRR